MFSLITNLIFSQKETRFSTYFATSKTNPNVKDFSNLQHYLDSISKLTYLGKIKVFGFCDDIGTTENNQKLSQKRAEFVSEQIKLQVKNNHTVIFAPKGMGEIEIKKNDSTLTVKEQRKQNRRVDIVIHFIDKTTLIQDYHEVGDKIILENVLFAGGNDRLLQESYKSLSLLLKTLKRKPKYQIEIQGHIHGNNSPVIDSSWYRPIDELSLRRAEKVYKFLVRKGINPTRLSYVGLEGRFPLKKDPKFNRRVEIEIKKIN